MPLLRLKRSGTLVPQPNSCEGALQPAAMLKHENVEIICIGTNDADKSFLDQLATRNELALHVGAQDIRTSMGQVSRLLLESAR
jgi:hypothetical protein